MSEFTTKDIEKMISELEAKFTIAMHKSIQDGDPKHRKKVVSDAVKFIESAITEARLDEIKLFREAMINHSTPMIYAPNRIKELKDNTSV